MYCNYNYKKYYSLYINEIDFATIRNNFHVTPNSIAIYNDGATFYAPRFGAKDRWTNYHFCPHSLELIHFLWNINDEIRKSICKYLNHNCKNYEEAATQFMAKVLSGK